MKVLIIDNDINTAETLKASLLAKSNFEVEVAYSGQEGLDKMRADSTYSLIILDVMMPGLSGIDVCKQMMLDTNLQKIPVLLASALPVASAAFQDSLEKFEELNVIKGVLEKPFTLDFLMEKVNNILSK